MIRAVHQGNNGCCSRDIEMWSPARTRGGATTNIVMAGDPNANYEMIARLDEERRRLAS